MAAISRQSPAPSNPIPNNKPFAKGVSGNPSGRPKDVLTHAIREKLTPDQASALADKLMALAMAGDLKALEIVLDRVEGKAVARQEQGDPGAFERLSALREMTPDELRALIRTVDGNAEPSTEVRRAS